MNSEYDLYTGAGASGCFPPDPPLQGGSDLAGREWRTTKELREELREQVETGTPLNKHASFALLDDLDTALAKIEALQDEAARFANEINHELVARADKIASLEAERDEARATKREACEKLIAACHDTSKAIEIAEAAEARATALEEALREAQSEIARLRRLVGNGRDVVEDILNNFVLGERISPAAHRFHVDATTNIVETVSEAFRADVERIMGPEATLSPSASRAGADRGEWRPIESAPKDGEPILAWVKGNIIELWWDNDPDYEAWVSGRQNNSGDLIEYQPSHWMRRPAPPPTPETTRPDPAAAVNVYVRPECLFKYCPDPEGCRSADECASPKITDKKAAQMAHDAIHHFPKEGDRSTWIDDASGETGPAEFHRGEWRER